MNIDSPGRRRVLSGATPAVESVAGTVVVSAPAPRLPQSPLSAVSVSATPALLYQPVTQPQGLHFHFHFIVLIKDMHFTTHDHI